MEYILIGIGIVCVILLIFILIKTGKKNDESNNIILQKSLDEIKISLDNGFRNSEGNVAKINEHTSSGLNLFGRNIKEDQEKLKDDVNKGLSDIQKTSLQNIKDITTSQQEHRKELMETLNAQRSEISDTLSKQRKETTDTFENVQRNLTEIRKEIAASLAEMKDANSNSLEKIRQDNQASMDKINETVNEKLQKTLEDKLSKSFETVRTQLTEVYKGLGEMKEVASGVTDLKNVLSNVKTRGIIGEYQLEAILTEILSPDQYEKQYKLVGTSREMVDFAIKLPGTDSADSYVYLPIDSKFPGDTYQNLLKAYESGDKNLIENCKKSLKSAITSEAKSISEKYIRPPYSTDFAILFLPFEGLYAEVVNMGLLEELQTKFKVNISGPSTTAALLNSFRMGFRTLAIQKKSGEVWKTLEAVKKEFSTFEEGLLNMKKKMNQADEELDKLIGTRTRAINRKLKEVTAVNTIAEADEILEIENREG